MADDTAHVFCQIAEVKTAEASGVGGQKGSGQGADLYPQSRENGDYGGEGTSSEPGQIMYGGDALDGGMHAELREGRLISGG